MRLVVVTDGNLQGTRLYDGEGVDVGSTWARVVGVRKDEGGDLRVSIEIKVMDIPLVQVRDDLGIPASGAAAGGFGRLVAEAAR